MRVTQQEIAAIKMAALDIFGQQAVIRLFGSRANDEARGGDLDLHLETDPDKADQQDELRFQSAVWGAMNELKVDLIVTKRGEPLTWIERAAYRDGIVL
jgi:predicted nucleotidyltransferase